MRLDQQERAIGQQVLPCAFEGMDHARDCDSSKRPAEECNLEWIAAEAKALGRGDTEGNIADAFRGSKPSSKGDLCGIGLDGDHPGG